MCFLCQKMPEHITREELWNKVGVARNGMTRLQFIIHNNKDRIPKDVFDEFNESRDSIMDYISNFSEETK